MTNLISVSSFCSLAVSVLCVRSTLEAQPTIRDSVGVRVVEHGLLPQKQAPFSVSETSLFDLGGLRANSAEELNSRTPFSSPQRLSDGRWAIVDWASIKLFDRAGRFVRSIAKPGQGPGEFRQIRAICVATGDTLIALSLLDRRVSAFDTLGTHLRSSVLPGEIRADPCFSDGSILVRHEAQPNPRSSLQKSQAELADRVRLVQRVRWDGTVVDTLGWLQAETQDWTLQEIENMAVRGQRIYVGNGTQPEYRVYDPNGALVQIVRWRANRVRATNDMRSETLRRGYRAGPYERELLPAYGAIQVGPDSSVWVQDYQLPGRARARYTVFDRSGLYVGKVELPPVSDARIDLPYIGKGEVVLQWRDSDGMLHLTTHAISPRR